MTDAEYIVHVCGEKQINQFVEESSELMKELMKWHRYKNNKEEIKEEIGDVLNTIDTLIELFNFDKEEISSIRLQKMNAYANKLKEEHE